MILRTPVSMDARFEIRIQKKATGLRSDQRILLQGPKTSQAYPDTLRHISHVDTDSQKRLVFLTNNFSLPALTIAHLNECRWRVELFFKWIKQSLRIKAFLGNSQNVDKTQVWNAISVYLLVAILKKELKISRGFGEILRILSITLSKKVSMNQVLKGFHLQQKDSDSCKQSISCEF